MTRRMRVLNRPGIGEFVLSTLCLLVVLTALVTVDARVRDHFKALVTPSSTSLGGWQEQVADLGAAVVQAARDGMIDEAPLLVFTAAGAALLVFMLRT